MWDVTRFWGVRAGIVLENKRLKKGCFFHSIDVFGIVFGMSKEGSELGCEDGPGEQAHEKKVG